MSKQKQTQINLNEEWAISSDEMYKGCIDPRVCKKLSQLAEEIRYVNH